MEPKEILSSGMSVLSVFLALVALSAQSLKVIDIVAASHGDRNDVINLEFNRMVTGWARTALNTAVVVTLKHNPSVLQRYCRPDRTIYSPGNQYLPRNLTLVKGC